MREAIRDIDRLRHIDECIGHINDYLSGRSFEDMKADMMCYHAVVYNIMIIGEAANMLTFDFREAHSDLKWRQITNMRNFLIHGYHNVEQDLVWEAISVDLNPIREKIVKYLEEFNNVDSNTH